MQLDFDLFISYSSRDKHIADALLAGLEADSIRCWIAPRNVQPGKTWAGSILRGIRDADVFVLILTEQSNQSNQVLNEVERAVSLQKSIVCYRAESIVLSDDLELFLSSKHWIEASGRPVNETIPTLVDAIRPLLVRRQAVIQPPVVVTDKDTTSEEREQFLRNGKKAYLAQDFTLASDYFNEAADAGSGEALFYLGEMHRKSEGTKRAPAKAKQFYKNAIEKGSALGNWGLAQMLDEADELPDRAKQYYEQAREAIAEKAVEEDAYCCYLYCLMYDGGKGINKDEKRAERWLEKAIENGYKPTYTISAKPLITQLEPVVKPSTVVELPKSESVVQPKPTETSTNPVQPTKSASPVPLVGTVKPLVGKQTPVPKKGTLSQRAFIGLAIALGTIVWVVYYSIKTYNENKAQSEVMIESALTDSTSIMTTDSTSTIAPDTVIKYDNKTPHELLKLAEDSDAIAQDWIGYKYQNGEGVEQNYQKALEWYRKSAEQGNSYAQYNLGFMYENGEGVSKDYQKALEWYRKSAKQGDSDAQKNLGFMYENGEGVSKDYQKALEWYRKSAEQGNAGAQNNLGVMYYDGTGVPKNYQKAYEWFRKAVDQGNAAAMYGLGLLYEYGDGVKQNMAEAKRLYKLSADKGDVFAEKALKRLKSN